MRAKQITAAEMERRIEEAERDREAALFLRDHHRAESVQLRERVAELQAELAAKDVELADALEMLGQAHGQALELETEIDARDEEESCQ